MKKDVKKSNNESLSVKGKIQLNKRTIVLLSCIAFIIIALVSVVVVHVALMNSEHDDRIYYFPAKYEEDVYQNKAYLSFERGLLFSESGVTQMYYYDTDYEEASAECQFFLDYFQSIIGGKYQEISKFYVDGYFKEEPKFTMQMIYEPYVLFHSIEEEELNGEKTKVYNFEVRYKIFKNNGTFRTGVASNTAIPQIYQVIKVDESYRICRILDIEYEFAED